MRVNYYYRSLNKIFIFMLWLIGVFSYCFLGSEIEEARGMFVCVDQETNVLFTFVTIPKPAKTAYHVNISRLVLHSWLSSPFVGVLMLMDERIYDPTGRVLPGIYKKYGKWRLRFHAGISEGYGHRPLIREWFKLGHKYTRSGYVCFLNGDILVPRQFLATCHCLFKKKKQNDKLIVYAGRNNVRYSTNLWEQDMVGDNFSEARLTHYVRENAYEQLLKGLDFIVFHCDFTALNWNELPDFVIGMCVWDNFFQAWANRRAVTVSLGFNPGVFHIDHEQHACTSANIKHFLRMAQRSPCYSGLHFLANATWQYHEGVVTERNTHETVILDRECIVEDGLM